MWPQRKLKPSESFEMGGGNVTSGRFLCVCFCAHLSGWSREVKEKNALGFEFQAGGVDGDDPSSSR